MAANRGSPRSGLGSGRDLRVPKPRDCHYCAYLAFLARRWARYFLISALDIFLCSEQTMPNTGAARPVQPGTGHSCLGRRLMGAAAAGTR